MSFMFFHGNLSWRNMTWIRWSVHGSICDNNSLMFTQSQKWLMILCIQSVYIYIHIYIYIYVYIYIHIDICIHIISYCAVLISPGYESHAVISEVKGDPTPWWCEPGPRHAASRPHCGHLGWHRQGAHVAKQQTLAEQMLRQYTHSIYIYVYVYVCTRMILHISWEANCLCIHLPVYLSYTYIYI